MSVSPAAKVGMVTVTAMILFLFVVTQIGRIGGGGDVEYRIMFESVGGLQERSPVYLAGVRIGYVKSLELVEASNNQVKATIAVTRPDVKLYRSRQSEEPDGTLYVYTITGNLMGDRWIEIKPGPVPADEPPLQAGGQVVGESPVTLDDLAREGNQVMEEFKESVVALNELVADEKFQQDIKLTMGNFQAISGNLKEVSEDAKVMVSGLNERVNRLGNSLESVVAHVDSTVLSFQSDARLVGSNLRGFSTDVRQLVNSNRGNLDTIVTNLRETSISLKKAMKVVEELAEDEGVRDDVLVAVKNLKKTSEEVQGIAADIRSLTSDPELQGDLRETVVNAREASASAKRVMGTVEGISSDVKQGKMVGGEIEQQWNTDTGEAHTNVNAFLFPEGKYGAKFGVDSLGNENLWNLQAMRNWDKWRLRGGMIRSQFGLGADARLFKKKLELSVDAYNTSDPQVDVLGKFLFKGDFFIQGGVRNATRDSKRFPVIGAGKRF